MRRDRAEQRQGHDLYFLKPPKTGFARTQRRELRLRKAHRPSWRRPPHRGGAPSGPCPRGRLLAGRRAGAPHAQTDAAAPQAHRPFYASLLALARTPRRLQHLCRCAIRRRLGRKCFHLVPLSPVPKSLQNYLLLEPEGVLH